MTPLHVINIADQPERRAAFEIINEGKHYKIYADGQIEGFDGSAIIINRIPALQMQGYL